MKQAGTAQAANRRQKQIVEHRTEMVFSDWISKARSSAKGRTVDALASQDDEGRGKLR